MGDTQDEPQPEEAAVPLAEPPPIPVATALSRILIAKAGTSISITLPENTRIRLPEYEIFEEDMAQCQKRHRREVQVVASDTLMRGGVGVNCAVEKELWTSRTVRR
jgi:hypothetical protein